MPWQLEEELYKAAAAERPDLIAEVGLKALAYEMRTDFDDKAIEYARAWQVAADLHAEVTAEPQVVPFKHI